MSIDEKKLAEEIAEAKVKKQGEVYRQGCLVWIVLTLIISAIVLIVGW
ncbi:MAG: hypothetical protein GY820_17280 [Gammaproteobacteria bacterium]|nr:hypothetical protein [Gammaproteobacteria bacterium]